MIIANKSNETSTIDRGPEQVLDLIWDVEIRRTGSREERFVRFSSRSLLGSLVKLVLSG
jgi:hypothetical protein